MRPVEFFARRRLLIQGAFLAAPSPHLMSAKPDWRLLALYLDTPAAHASSSQGSRLGGVSGNCIPAWLVKWDVVLFLYEDKTLSFFRPLRETSGFWFRWSASLQSRSGALRTQKSRSALLRTQSWRIFSLLTCVHPCVCVSVCACVRASVRANMHSPVSNTQRQHPKLTLIHTH